MIKPETTGENVPPAEIAQTLANVKDTILGTKTRKHESGQALQAYRCIGVHDGDVIFLLRDD